MPRPVTINRRCPQALGLIDAWALSKGAARSINLRSPSAATGPFLEDAVLPRSGVGLSVRPVAPWTASYLSTPFLPSYSHSGHFTWAAWIRTIAGNTQYPSPAAWLSDTFKGAGLVWSTALGGIAGQLGWGTGWVFTPAYPTAGDTDWHHFAAVYNGTNFALYVDGKSYGTPTAHTTAPVVHTGDIVFGTHYANHGGGWDFCGDVADVRYYRYAVPEGIIRQMADLRRAGDLYR